jgi:hypothetical protein
MAIKGYSERGVINSIAYFLDSNQEYIYDFIKLLNIPLQEGEYDYVFLVEQSFSDFGDSDLIIIVNEKIKNERFVIFIECKIKTFLGKFSMDNEFNEISAALKDGYKSGISSNLFVQLYYKYLLVKTNGQGDPKDKEIFMKYNRKTKTRNICRIIGNNKIVKHAFKEYIKNAKDCFYAAIVPTPLSEMNDGDFQNKINLLKLMPSTNAHSCYWGVIHDYFKNIKATKALEVFCFNDKQIY